MLELEARLLTAKQEAQQRAADAREQAQRLQVGEGCLDPDFNPKIAHRNVMWL